MNKNLLSVFNSYAFNTTAHALLDALAPQDLEQLLKAIFKSKGFQQLSHLITAKLLGTVLHQLDRTFYFTHYQGKNIRSINQVRCNEVAFFCQPLTLNRVYDEYKRIQRKGAQLFGDVFQVVRETVESPGLALPPYKRETIAPHCQTVYQIVLACQKLNCYQREQNYMLCQIPQEDQTIQYFFEILQAHIRLVKLYLSCIQNQLEHFSELTLRFMAYRNTVIALNELCPFPQLTLTMQLWTREFRDNYERANRVYASLAGFSRNQIQSQDLYCNFSSEKLSQEGYLIEYVEGLIDQSINADLAAFCGHSKQFFGQQYRYLEEQLLCHLDQFQIANVSFLQIESKLLDWENLGVKPCTLLKIIEKIQSCNSQCKQVKQSLCCRQDSFIENCARINGLLDSSNLHIQCF